LAEYLADMQADVANSSQIDGGLKKGIEYRYNLSAPPWVDLLIRS